MEDSVTHSAGTETVNIYGGHHAVVHGNQIQYISRSAGTVDRPEDLVTHAHILEGRANGTCTWLFDTPELECWLKDPAPRLLWLCGGAGCGKTHLASALVEHLQQQQTVVFPFYLEYGKSSRRRRRPFATFIDRLQVQIEFAHGDLLNTAEWDSIRRETDPKNQARLLMEGLQRSERSVWIVLDQLDNYSNEDHDIDILLRGLLSQPNVKVLVTSRRTTRFTRILNRHQALRREVEPPASDVELFIRSTIQREISQWSNAEEAICSTIMDHMGKQTSFSLARHLLLPLKQLDTDGQLVDNLTHLSRNTQAYYARLVYAVGQQEEARSVKGTQVLTWLSGAKDMAVDDLQFALNIELGRTNVRDYFHPEPEADLLEVTQGLVEFSIDEDEDMMDEDDGEDGGGGCQGRKIVRLVNKSVFLSDYLRSTLKESPDASMTRTFLKYLAQERFTLSYMSKMGATIDDYLVEEPFLVYIQCAWELRATADEDLVLTELFEYFKDSDRAGFFILLLQGSLPEVLKAHHGLHAAAYSGLFMTVLELLRSGAQWCPDPALVEALGRRTPLHLAAQFGDSEDFKHMTQADLAQMDLNAQDEKGRTPFSYAAGTGGFEVVQILLSSGRVDINSRDYKGRTPLRRAVKLRLVDDSSVHQAQINTVKLLVGQPSIDINAQDAKGQSALLQSARLDIPEKTQMRLVKALLKHPNIDRNLRDRKGQSAADHAQRRGRMELLEVIGVGNQAKPRSWLAMSST